MTRNKSVSSSTKEKIYLVELKSKSGFKAGVNLKGDMIIPPNFKHLNFGISRYILNQELIPAGIRKPEAKSAMDAGG